MVAYTRKKIETLIELDFIRFSIVGGLGFVINFVILTLLTKFFAMPVFFAQLIGAEVALFSNFMLHHNWTYRTKKVKKSIPNLLVQFHATSWPAIVGSSLMVTGGVRFLHISKLDALVISSIIAFAWNFAWSKFVIWRDVSQKDLEKLSKEAEKSS